MNEKWEFPELNGRTGILDIKFSIDIDPFLSRYSTDDRDEALERTKGYIKRCLQDILPRLISDGREYYIKLVGFETYRDIAPPYLHWIKQEVNIGLIYQDDVKVGEHMFMSYGPQSKELNLASGIKFVYEGNKLWKRIK